MTQIFNKESEKSKRRALRNEMPKAERLLWGCLRNKKLDGFRFRRQYSMNKYVLDFYCSQRKLAFAIDVDFNFEEGNKKYDKDRQKKLNHLGLNFLGNRKMCKIFKKRDVNGLGGKSFCGAGTRTIWPIEVFGSRLTDWMTWVLVRWTASGEATAACLA